MTLEVDYWPPITEITMQWHHVDGPLMRRRDGSLKWLSRWERIMHAFGLWSLEHIEKRP